MESKERCKALKALYILLPRKDEFSFSRIKQARHAAALLELGPGMKTESAPARSLLLLGDDNGTLSVITGELMSACAIALLLMQTSRKKIKKNPAHLRLSE